MVKIAAVGDVHSPKRLSEFLKALKAIESIDVDLFLLVGDIIYKGEVLGLKPVIESITRRFSCPVVGVFGNEEYDDVKDDILKASTKIVWLDDSSKTFEVDDVKISVVGSRGCLDKPTNWQSRNIPRIREIYNKRLDLISNLLREARRGSDLVVLTTHYPPTYKTLKGEPRMFWPQMACSKMEHIIVREKPDIVIHAHTHNSVVKEVEVGGVRIVNASLPARSEIAIISIKPKMRLEKFL